MTDQRTLSEAERADLVAYLDGELDEPAARALEAKLQRDPVARAEAERLRRTWDMLDYLPRPEPRADFMSRTLERVSVHRPVLTRSMRRDLWRRRALAAGWAAAVLVAGAAGYGATVWYSRDRQPPVPSGPAVDQQIVRDFRVLENLHLYDHVDDINFLRELAEPNDPDLFGDDHFGS